MFPLGTAFAVSDTLYLEGDGVPTASLTLVAPTASVLPNYDPGRDAFPGLLLAKSDEGLNETDPTRYQLWVGSATGIDLDGVASLTFWSAMKDFDTDKKGAVQAYLLDCTPSGASCNLIDSASKTLDPWNGDFSASSSWVSGTISFGSVTYTVLSGRSLAVKVVVGGQSGDDMWFAYDTTSYPSSLTVQLAPPPTTTTSVPPTTTTTSTTTTIPGATTTSTVPSGAVPPGSTTTTSPAVTSTDPPLADQSAGEPGDVEDRALLPLPDAGQVETSVDRGLSGTFIDALELVIPPRVATALVSPLLVVEAFVAALTDSGRTLLMPGLLLLLGAAWMANESRFVALLGLLRRRRQQGAEQ